MAAKTEEEIAKIAKLVADIVLALMLISMSVVRIPAGHRGVVMHFGQVQDLILDEGLHFKVPVMTTIYEVSVRVHKDEIAASAASKDLQEVSSRVAINWHPSPTRVNTIYQQVGPEEAITVNILQPNFAEVFKAASAKLSAEEILIKRVELKEEVDANLKERLQKFDIVVDAVSLVDITFSKEFNRAIEEKQVAEQNAKKASYMAQQAAEEAKAEIARAKGKAEAQRLQEKTLTDKYLQLMALDKWDGKLPHIMTGDGALPFIDLQKAGK